MKRAALAIAGGLAQFLAFPPVGWWWTAPFGVALFVLAVRGARPGHAALLGLLAGLAFYIPLLQWVAVLGWDAWLILGVAMSGWSALLGWAIRMALELKWWVIAVPATWVLVEWLRSRFPWGGLGWGRLAFSQPDTVLTGWVTAGGAPLLSLLVAMLGCLAVAVWPIRRASLAALGGIVAILLVGALIFPAPGTPSPVDRARLAVIQGNVPQPGIDFLGRPLQVLTNHVRTTQQLARAVRSGSEPAPDAVIWPENSADIDPVQSGEAGQLVASAADTIDAPVLVGTVQQVPGQPDRVANVGLVWQPGAGPSDAYVKQHPVPFGEFLPMRALLSSLISRFDRVPRDFIAGEEPGVLQLGPARVADVICFEISSDEIVRTGVRSGGRAVVVQTNNATYATTAQPEQQFDISRMRARETGRSVLVAATTGVTAVISPDGSYQALPTLTSAWLNPDVILRDAQTPAVRFGGWIDGLLSLLGLAAVLLGLWGHRRTTRPSR